MFPRAERLRRRRDIERILKRGRRVSAPGFTIRSLPNPIGGLRVTVVVGTAVEKRAPARNRLKRQVRHQLRGLLTPNTAIDLMVTLKPDIRAIPPLERRRNLESVLKKIGLLSSV